MKPTHFDLPKVDTTGESTIEDVLDDMRDSLREMVTLLSSIADRLDNINGAHGLDDLVQRLEELKSDVTDEISDFKSDVSQEMFAIKLALDSISMS